MSHRSLLLRADWMTEAVSKETKCEKQHPENKTLKKVCAKRLINYGEML